ncbi:Maf family protein [Simiduia curdlanivorans]|uniref:dTTP/UTP pyrophosphatase n=1 Tax=Simiduia curdlanivorans TaxID=1492769 RepID=A0ABV8V8V2_9GAMM|nr:Maf family protein [Simiduia curdlanivorans]MDN3638909.1 Maf family protein [Simiduia curdlanivorans]
MVKSPLVLASQSPRRKEILLQLGVNFKQIAVDVEEIPLPHESPAAYVCRLAEAKARAGYACQNTAGAVVLGADTVVVCDEQILEKPESEAHAKSMWRRLSGRSHEVLTSVCMFNGQVAELELSVTQVQFTLLTDHMIDNYWLTGEGLDKAGGYAIQGMGAAFVKAISGSYSGVVGLPIEKLIPLFDQFDIAYWCQPVKNRALD